MGPRQKDSQDPWNPGSLPLFTYLRIGEVGRVASVVLWRSRAGGLNHGCAPERLLSKFLNFQPSVPRFSPSVNGVTGGAYSLRAPVGTDGGGAHRVAGTVAEA